MSLWLFIILILMLVALLLLGYLDYKVQLPVHPPLLDGDCPENCISNQRCKKPQSCTNSTSWCCYKTTNGPTLVAVTKLQTDQLTFLLHPTVTGFRKIPTGIGLSPFLLCLSSTLLVQYYRKQFIRIFTFAYMDDLVVGCKNPTHLHAAVHRTVHRHWE